MGENEVGSAKEESKEEGEVMDTPERGKNTQIATPVAKFEESPVFNFLNNLSPIQQVKSIHITQTINPLSFASIPSVFTSPHVSSLKESRFLRRYQIPDPSKPEFSSSEGISDGKDKANMDAADQIDQLAKNLDQMASGSEQSLDCTKLVVVCADDPNNSLALVPYIEENEEANVEGTIQVHENKDAPPDWDALMSDNLFNFESPNCTDPDKKLVDQTSFYASIENDMQNMHSLCVFGEQQAGEGSESDHMSTQPGDRNEVVDNAETVDTSMTDPDGNVFLSNLPGFYRGMRRRCLVFEMVGVRRKHLEEHQASDSSLLLQSEGNASPIDQKAVSLRTGNDSSRCVLPGIGLHLNALATTSKDYKIVNHDSSASRRLVIGPGPSSSVNFPNTSQELLDNAIPVVLPNEEIDTMENIAVPVDDGQGSSYNANDEINNNSSPKKKRRRPDQTGEAEACKRCNCKKSKCLKLYCECFAAGVYCVEPCACIDCFNKPVHEDTVLATRKQIESRNPLAFAPKVIRGPDSTTDAAGEDSSKTPASARHKRGCNCKKSGCLKKYCECYQGGVGCSINCRCEGCKNAFGRKEGSTVIAMEVEADEVEMETNEKAVVKNDSDQNNAESALPATPLRAVRQPVHLPFSSKKKPPKYAFPSIGSSSGLYVRRGPGNPSFEPQPKCNNNVEAAIEEMPEFLQEGSPAAGVKSNSPKQKRVSPPHNGGMSPSLRSSRKLILQSIPSFPSLSQNQ